jgi:hypothetical protein
LDGTADGSLDFDDGSLDFDSTAANDNAEGSPSSDGTEDDGIPELCSGCYFYWPQQQEQELGNWQTTTRPELNRAYLCFYWCGKEIRAHILTTLVAIRTLTIAIS